MSLFSFFLQLLLSPGSSLTCLVTKIVSEFALVAGFNCWFRVKSQQCNAKEVF